jgi:hypothetical protein
VGRTGNKIYLHEWRWEDDKWHRYEYTAILREEWIDGVKLEESPVGY